MHGLLEDDSDQRLQFCEVLLDEHRNHLNNLDCILFSDKAQFKLNGLVNRHNSVYYNTVNPHITYEAQLNQPGMLVVRAGFTTFGIFGPCFSSRPVLGNLTQTCFEITYYQAYILYMQIVCMRCILNRMLLWPITHA